VKNNIIERSEHIGKISSDGIYKFRDLIFDKYGKEFLDLDDQSLISKKVIIKEK